jgi:hypothetical protein
MTLPPLTLSPPLFTSFCAKYNKDSDKDASNLETLKDFVQEVSYGMNGIEGKDGLQISGGRKGASRCVARSRRELGR